MLELVNMLVCNLFAFGANDGVSDGAGSVVVDKWKSSDGGYVLEDC